MLDVAIARIFVLFVASEAGRELPDFDGCLSLPGLHAETMRPHFMRLQGLDERGKAFEWSKAPALTRCPQCGGEVQRVISGGTIFLKRRASCSSASSGGS